MRFALNKRRIYLLVENSTHKLNPMEGIIMTKQTQPKAKKVTTKTGAASLTGEHFTLEQVALECIRFETVSEDLKEEKATLSDHFLSAAKLYIKKPKEGEEMLEDHPFLAACKAQEKLSKESKGMDAWDTVPRSWTQLKSNMKQSFNIGLDVNKYKTEGALRTDLNKARKDKKEADKTPEQKAVEQVTESLGSIVETGETVIQQRIFAIIEACKNLSEAQADDVAAVLETTLADINVLKVLGDEQRQLDAA